MGAALVSGIITTPSSANDNKQTSAEDGREREREREKETGKSRELQTRKRQQSLIVESDPESLSTIEA